MNCVKCNEPLKLDEIVASAQQEGEYKEVCYKCVIEDLKKFTNEVKNASTND